MTILLLQTHKQLTLSHPGLVSSYRNKLQLKIPKLMKVTEAA